jgi:hypothetical protein
VVSGELNTYRRLRGLVLALCIWFAWGEGFQEGLERRGEEFRPSLFLCDLSAGRSGLWDAPEDAMHFRVVHFKL